MADGAGFHEIRSGFLFWRVEARFTRQGIRIRRACGLFPEIRITLWPSDRLFLCSSRVAWVREDSDGASRVLIRYGARARARMERDFVALARLYAPDPLAESGPTVARDSEDWA